MTPIYWEFTPINRPQMTNLKPTQQNGTLAWLETVNSLMASWLTVASKGTPLPTDSNPIAMMGFQYNILQINPKSQRLMYHRAIDSIHVMGGRDSRENLIFTTRSANNHLLLLSTSLFGFLRTIEDSCSAHNVSASWWRKHDDCAEILVKEEKCCNKWNNTEEEETVSRRNRRENLLNFNTNHIVVPFLKAGTAQTCID